MTEEIREVSNTIWNTSGKMTHNELDDLLEKLVDTTLQAERERLVSEIEKLDRTYDNTFSENAFVKLEDVLNLINPPSKE